MNKLYNYINFHILNNTLHNLNILIMIAMEKFLKDTLNMCFISIFQIYISLNIFHLNNHIHLYRHIFYFHQFAYFPQDNQIITKKKKLMNQQHQHLRVGCIFQICLNIYQNRYIFQFNKKMFDLINEDNYNKI